MENVFLLSFDGDCDGDDNGIGHRSAAELAVRKCTRADCFGYVALENADWIVDAEGVCAAFPGESVHMMR